MAVKNKTTVTQVDVRDFINTYVSDAQKKEDSYQLIALLEQWSGFPPKMWGPSIIGFGSYHYQYDSGHQGDAPILGFSPRKAAFSLYIYAPTEENKLLLDSLGKFKMAKACLYIKKLSDINIDVLERICRSSKAYVEEKHQCGCREM